MRRARSDGEHEAERNIAVLALTETDENLFKGSLMYRSGLDLQVLEQLEKARKPRLEAIVPFMRDNNLTQKFTSTKHSCSFVKDLSIADTVVVLVDAKHGDVDAAFRPKELDQAIGSRRNIVVVGENMQEVEWNAQLYDGLVTRSQTALLQRGAHVEQLRFVPASSASGDNILEPSSKSSWHFRQAQVSGRQPLTVLQAIDE